MNDKIDKLQHDVGNLTLDTTKKQFLRDEINMLKHQSPSKGMLEENKSINKRNPDESFGTSEKKERRGRSIDSSPNVSEFTYEGNKYQIYDDSESFDNILDNLDKDELTRYKKDVKDMVAIHKNGV